MPEKEEGHETKQQNIIRKNRKIIGDNKKLKEEHEELTSLSNRLSNILDADNIYDAKRRFNILNNQKDHLPEEFVKALNGHG